MESPLETAVEEPTLVVMVTGRRVIGRSRRRQQRPTRGQQGRSAAVTTPVMMAMRAGQIDQRLGLYDRGDRQVMMVVMTHRAQLQVGLAVLVALNPLAGLVKELVGGGGGTARGAVGSGC